MYCHLYLALAGRTLGKASRGASGPHAPTSLLGPPKPLALSEPGPSPRCHLPPRPGPHQSPAPLLRTPLAEATPTQPSLMPLDVRGPALKHADPPRGLALQEPADQVLCLKGGVGVGVGEGGAA